MTLSFGCRSIRIKISPKTSIPKYSPSTPRPCLMLPPPHGPFPFVHATTLASPRLASPPSISSQDHDHHDHHYHQHHDGIGAPLAPLEYENARSASQIQSHLCVKLSLVQQVEDSGRLLRLPVSGQVRPACPSLFQTRRHLNSPTPIPHFPPLPTLHILL